MTAWIRAHAVAIVIAFCGACGSGSVTYAAVQSRIAVLEVKVEKIDRIEAKVDLAIRTLDRIAGRLESRPRPDLSPDHHEGD